MRRKEIEQLHTNLLEWFRSNGRSLPWRKKGASAYERWISEIMLQQTRVETVLPYFEKFIRTFPTVSDLAKADVDQVQEMWAGLGYYSRARNLHKCANEIVNTYGGKFPTTVNQLQTLPGIGPYTAAAIASMAFNQRVASIDGNLERVLARVLHLTEVAKGNSKIAILAQAIVSLGNAGKVNEAFMDLSSLVCKVKNPDCLLCPLSQSCRTKLTGDFDKIPAKAPKKVKKILHTRGVLFYCKDKSSTEVLLARRPDGAWLSKMWDLPWTILDANDSPWDLPGKPMGTTTVKRTITNHKINFTIEARAVPLKLKRSALGPAIGSMGSEFRWVSISDAKSFLPNPSAKALNQLLKDC